MFSKTNAKEMFPLLHRRIFIIEDIVTNAIVMQLALEHAGAITAIERGWGNHLERIERFLPIDMILLDLMLPNNVSGFDIIYEIKQVLPNIPIVAVSAMDPSQARELAHQHGFSGFISKPVDSNNFPKQILAILNDEEERQFMG